LKRFSSTAQAKETIMDPNSLWQELCAALRAQDAESASDRAAQLLYWLEDGGSPPQLIQPDDLNQAARWKVARQFCLSVLARSGGVA
jgi:hypothetical protein